MLETGEWCSMSFSFVNLKTQRPPKKNAPEAEKIKDRNKEARARKAPGESREEGAELAAGVRVVEALGLSTKG